VGLLVLPWAWRRLELAPANRRDLAVLAGFVLLFVLALSIFPKKLNRYLVPVFPALDVLAAVGVFFLWHQAKWLQQRIAGTGGAGARYALAALFFLALVLNVAWWHPYGVVAFNQLLGGAPAGACTFLLGDGEGLGQAADWLNQQPDITGVLTVSRMISSLNPYLKEGAQAFFHSQGELRHNAGYVVVYINEVQGGPPLPPFDRFYEERMPLHTVTIHGVEYAWIYQVPPPVAQPRPADFGPHIHLRGFEQISAARREQPVVFRLSWQTRASLDTDYWLFAHLIGPDGQRYAQVDIPYRTSTWQPGRYVNTELPLDIPASAPPGSYRLLIGLYDPATAQRLPLSTAAAADLALSGPDALLLAVVVLE
jgi:hypothetical protein